MKTSLKLLTLSALLSLTGISYAQQPTHQGPMSGDMMGMEHGMGTMDPAKYLVAVKFESSAIHYISWYMKAT